MLDAGVIHQNIEGTEALFGLADHFGDFGGTRHVGWRKGRLDLKFTRKGGADRFNLRGVAEAVQGDIGPRFGEAACDGEADAACGSGDERVLSLEQGRAPWKLIVQCNIGVAALFLKRPPTR
jgi:hypothetical protein